MTHLHGDEIGETTQLRSQVAGRPGEERASTLTSADRPYRLIVEEMNEGAVTTSRHGVILSANPYFQRILGTADPLAGKSLTEFVQADDRSIVAELLALRAGQRARVEVRLLHEPGPIAVPTILAASCLEFEGSPVVCIVATDLTAQKEVEETLRDSERRLRDFLEAVPVGVYVAARDGDAQEANREARRLLGCEDLDSCAAAAAELTHAAGEPAGPLDRALAGEKAHLDEVAVGGDGRLLEVWGTPVREASGDVEFAILVLADITARRRAEREIARQAAMLELAHDAVLMWDADGRINFWNKGAETLYDWPREQALGALAHEVMQTQWTEPGDAILSALERDGAWEGELEQRRRDGEPLVVNSRWAEYRDSNGELIGVLEVNRDITARKRAELALAERAADLERSNAELEQFAYSASHDLSEPLRAISGHVSLLAARYRGRMGPEADESIGFAVDGCARMQQTIQGLLLYSRVGRLESPPAEVDCAAVMEEVLTSLQPRIEESDARITVGPMPIVIGVADQLAQILLNLVSNAIKFVPDGVVPVVAVEAERREHDWRFTVTDNGIGVPPRHRDRIFGMFKRLHPSDQYPGTGIGLALVRKAVQRHDGEVGVEDPPAGTGARFWFTVPDPDPSRPHGWSTRLALPAGQPPTSRRG